MLSPLNRRELVDLASGLTRLLRATGLDGDALLKMLFLAFGFTEEQQNATQEATIVLAVQRVTAGDIDPQALEIPTELYVETLLAKSILRAGYDDEPGGANGGPLLLVVRENLRNAIREAMVRDPLFKGKPVAEILDDTAKRLMLSTADVEAIEREHAGIGEVPHAEDLFLSMYQLAEDRRSAPADRRGQDLN